MTSQRGITHRAPVGPASLAAALLLLALAGAPALASTGTCTGFSPARFDLRGAPPQIAQPIATLPGDFNRDGILDLAIVNKYVDGSLQNGSVTVLKGDIGGGLTAISTRSIAGGSVWAAAGDLDVDGKIDLAIVNDTGVIILLGDGVTGFLAPTTIPLGFNPAHISLADMNKDGKPDLVIVQQAVGQASGRVVTLLGDGTGGFTQGTPALVGQSPLGAVVGDFNKDGKLDVVAGSSLSNDVTFLPGLGDGNFGAPLASAVGATTTYLGAAELDKDGILDIVASGQTTGQHVMSLHGMGTGSFIVQQMIPDGVDPRNPIFCDFDRDTNMDVAIPDGSSSNITMLHNLGNGTFAVPLPLGTDHGPAQAAILDMNGDGFCDVTTANQGSDSVSVLLGDALGSLGAPTTATGQVPIGAATADFNHDGYLDLAVANRDDDTLSILRGDGEGSFFLSQVVPVGIAPGAVAADDFNLDGYADLVVANQGLTSDMQGDNINVLYNDTTGNFVLTHTLTVGDQPLDVKTNDFNGDGLPDIVVANGRSDKVSFFFAQLFNGMSNVKNVRIGYPQRSLAIGDYDGDGVKDVAISLNGLNEVMTLLSTGGGNFSKGPITTLPSPSVVDQIVGGDVNGDGVPDVLAICKPADPFAPGELTTLLGLGELGLLDPQATVQTGARPEALALIDLDGVGLADAVVANRLDNDLSTFIRGPSGFVPDGRFGTGNDPIYFVPGDFNNDDRTDIVVLNSGSASLSLLLNNTKITDPIPNLTFDATGEMTWAFVPGAVSYRVYRDTLASLRPDNYGLCYAAPLYNAQYTDGYTPPPGQGFFYLITASLGGGVETPLGYSSSCLKRINFHPCLVP